MFQRLAMVTGATVIAVASAAPFVQGSQKEQPQKEQAASCKASGSLMRMRDLPEASGLAVSKVTPGRLWAHNDSGKPELLALDAKGQVAGRVPVSGAAVEDWEAIASGPCGSTSCLYVADIGDNSAKRRNIVVYRIPEPSKVPGTAQVDAVYRATYPDGAHDAEALLVAPDGGLYIVTKGDTGHVALYRFPRELQAGTTMRLERIGSPMSNRSPKQDARITDGAISSDGEWVVLRTQDALMFYRAADFLKGQFQDVRRADLKSLGEPQGEGVALGAGDTVYVAGEGGGAKQPGTLAVLACSR